MLFFDGEFYKLQAQLERELAALYGRYPSLDPSQQVKRGGTYAELAAVFNQMGQAAQELVEAIGLAFAPALQGIVTLWENIQRPQNEGIVLTYLDNHLPEWVVSAVCEPIIDRLPDSWIERLAGWVEGRQ